MTDIIPNSVDGLQALYSGIIEVATDGERRAHAEAILREIAPNTYIVIPLSLREIAGTEVSWVDPPPGDAIMSLTPVRTEAEATDLLRWWSCKTFSERTSLYR